MIGRTVVQGVAANFDIPLVRRSFQFGHPFTEYIFQVVSDFRSGRIMENIMMNFLDCRELFGLDELNRDITNATEVYTLWVHVSPSSNPDSNVCSN